MNARDNATQPVAFFLDDLPALLTALNGLTVAQLADLRDAIEDLRLTKVAAERDAVLAEARDRLAQLGLSLDDALKSEGQDSRKTSRHGHGPAKVPPKYRGPNGEQWSGRGRQPHWVRDLVASGQRLDDCLISRLAGG